ncbi:MAG: polysaccharide biosynthesis protein, partial [Gammaproteobacteria bacterium]|nr:polysaccharide biosynthesis protein [Gammaproteobacteria bacterium]
QIRQGGPVTVTHPEITRYFMTISEASQLVLQASTMGEGGDVFVLDMGEPVKIVDLAKSMIHLSGYKVQGDGSSGNGIQIKYTGLRPGEKLYEELLIGDNALGTDHPKIMRAEENELPYDVVIKYLSMLEEYCKKFDALNVVNILKDAVIEYKPEKQVIDPVWQRYTQLKQNEMYPSESVDVATELPIKDNKSKPLH